VNSCEALATSLANGPKAIGVIKKAINAALKMNFEETPECANLLQYQLVHTEGHKETVKAFLEKKKTVFKGK